VFEEMRSIEEGVQPLAIEAMKKAPSIDTEACDRDGRSSRRRFLFWSAAAVAGSGAAAGAYAHWIEPHWYEIVRRDLPVAGLPDELIGRTVLQLSDMHVGPVVDNAYLIAAFQAAQKLKPDIVALTGDYITYEDDSVWAQMEEVYAHVPHGSIATVGCLGNHDYGQGWVQPDVAQRVTQRLEQAGVDVLRPGVTNVRGLAIAGLDDLWGANWNRGPAEKVIPQSGPSIVLCHNPDGVDIAMWGRFQGWVLAGHTHGGQVRLPFCSPPVLPVGNRRYTAGEFDVGKGRRLYINRGLGYLRKVRFCVRPEMTLFTLRNA
jgi:predicted MPP superfamily phosphohydrolase